MKLVYTHENKILVENAKNLLSEHGIEAVLRNEFSSGAMGDLSPMDTWPEVWVNDDAAVQAEAVVAALKSAVQGPTWQCAHCHEENEASFDVCWQCQTEKPAV